MTEPYRLETTRLILRQWRSDDYAEFAGMNADPDVMRYFPSLLSRAESDVLCAKFENLIADKGWGFWVTERKGDGAFLGLVDLNQVDDLPIASCIEVGWRLAKAYWGMGYATEAAAASLQFAFSTLHQQRVAAFTAVENFPSQKVMSRLGMRDRQENFLHPRVPSGSGLQEHVYYDIDSEGFIAKLQDGSAIVSSPGGEP